MKLFLESGGLEDQPHWWQNFIKDIDNRYGHHHWSTNRPTNIHTEIKLANAKVLYRDPENISTIIGLVFDNDADASWFLLKWS